MQKLSSIHVVLIIINNILQYFSILCIQSFLIPKYTLSASSLFMLPLKIKVFGNIFNRIKINRKYKRIRSCFSYNICIGVRWLFTKKITAKARLHCAVTWDDAVAEYKGILEDVKNGKDPRNEMKIFHSLYKQLLEAPK
jgi:hypothetical protein